MNPFTVIFAIILSFYEFIWPLSLVVFYRKYLKTKTKVESVALIAFLSLSTNYFIIEFISRFTQWPPGLPACSRGSSELLILFGLLVSFVLSIISIKNKEHLSTRLTVLCYTSFAISTMTLVGAVGFFIYFIMAMAAF